MREGWKRVRLDDAAEVAIGRQRAPKHAKGPYIVPYMRAANVKDGRLLLGDVLRMNFDRAEQATFGLRFGDVLVTEGCGSIGELGASARWSNEMHGPICFQNTLLRLRARPDVTLPGFVEQWSRWAHKSGIWAGVAGGTNIFHIGLTRAKEVPILLPPLAEQRRIVDLIAAVDAAIEAAERELEAAVALRRNTVSDQLGEERVAREGWRTSRLEAVARLSLDRVVVRPGETYRSAGVFNTGRGVFDRGELSAETAYSSLHRLRTSQLVMRKLTAWEGTLAVVPERFDGYVVTGEFPTFDLDADMILPSFVNILSSYPPVWEQMKARVTGTVQRRKRLYPDQLLAIVVPLPPLEAQQRTVGLVDALDAVVEACVRWLKVLNHLRSALLSDILSGDHEIPDSYDELLSA